MSKSRLFKLVLIVMVVSLALALASSALAQGPGGGGRGQGGQGGQGGRGGQFGAGDGVPNSDGVPNLDGSGGMGFAGQNQNQNQLSDGSMWLLPAASDLPLTPEVIEALLAGWQDETNAYNTYQAVIDQFGAVRPFTAIQAAEAQHISQLEFLFERYAIDIPEPQALAVIPQFATLADACAAGAEAEIANFGLYDQWIATTENYPDIAWVFTSLRDASEFRHLPVFERCAG